MICDNKVVFFGDSGCGKSSIIHRRTTGVYFSSVCYTVGTEFRTTHATTQDNEKILLHLWDTAGQERFKSFVKLYFRDAKVAVFVFDLSNAQTLYNINNWITECSINMDVENLPIMFLVGNKHDLIDELNMPSGLINEINTYVKNHDMTYVETSAKTGYNMDELFDKITEKIVEKYGIFNCDVKDETINLNSTTSLYTIHNLYGYCNIP
jgi:small GTP-binding protein